MRPVLAVFFALAGCVRAGTYHCAADEDCVSAAERGRCEAGLCSFRDDGCGSGWRFGDLAGDRSSQCVMDADAGPGVDAAPGDAPGLPDDGGDAAACGALGGACCAGATCDSPWTCAGGTCGCVAELEVGSRGACVIKTDGTLWCWGDNGYGQLAVGVTGGFQTTAGRALGIGGVTQASVASTGCAVVGGAGELWCWGHNHQGQVGDGTTTDHDAPVPVSLDGVAEVRPLGWFTCARRIAGDVWCWGYGAAGRLGNGGTSGSTTPVPVAPLPATVALDNGGIMSCALAVDGRLFCWGENTTGAIGDGSTTNALSPKQVSLPGPVAEASVGSWASGGTGWPHVCARLDDASVWCWGFNDFGQLGDGTMQMRRSPVRVAGLPPAAEVAAGGTFTCARAPDEHVWCWGDNGRGELGNGSGTPSLVPIEVPGLAEVIQIEAGIQHACARTRDGRLLCWGANDLGQLGTGDTVDRSTPTPPAFACP